MKQNCAGIDLLFHLPISIPDERIEKKWDVVGEELRSMPRARRVGLLPRLARTAGTRAVFSVSCRWTS